jgi:hypothetical protein
MIRGKNIKATANDIAEGYTAVNPILLKPLDGETIKELYRELTKKQGEIRGEKFPAHDMQGIRWRNLRLQRLHTGAMVIRNFAKMRKIVLI